MTYVLRPAVSHPPHRVTTDEIRRDLHRANPDYPRRGIFDRLARSVGVDHRYFSEPLDVVAAASPLPERTRAAYGHLRRRGAEAARQAMADHGIEPGEIDVLVTAHATGDHKPGLDVALINDLKLRPTVRRVGMTQLACAGGTQALIQASDVLNAGRGQVAMVVVAETLSTVYHHSDLSSEAVVFKYLFGDSGGATFVTREKPADRPSLEILDTFEYLLPDSEDYYAQRLEADGYHFDSTKKALLAVGEVMPQVTGWLRAGEPDWAPDHVIAHPGGPKILQSVVEGFGGPPGLVRHSVESMRDGGNRGGVAVLDVLRRALDADDLSAGWRGCILAFGPGFMTSALKTRAHLAN